MTVKTDQIQAGISNTATNNFTVTTDQAGGMKLARGNAGATTQDLITVAADGNVQLTKTSSQSMVRLNTANGYGSTNTKIRRFTNTVANQGSDITYTDSATLGASFTINTNGVYAISYNDQFSGADTYCVTLNDSSPTLPVGSVAASEILVMMSTASANYSGSVHWAGYLPSGSVIRAHTNGAATGAGGAAQFTIARVA